MNITMERAVSGGSIAAIPSKSFAHRMLISAALSDRDSQIVCGSLSEDIRATARCMAALSAEISYEDGLYTVKPHSAAEKAVLDCGESGSTFRFVLPIAAALGTEADFVLHGRLSERPMRPLYDALEANGAQIGGEGTETVRCSGKLRAGDYHIPADISSQFISGLLFALPLLEGDSRIILSGKIASAPYLAITRDVQKRFGIVSEQTDYGFFVKGNQRYLAQQRMVTEGDWSNAAFWLAAGAMTEQGITCTNLNLSSLQGDREVVEILRRFGAEVAEGDGSVCVRRASMHGIEIDAEHIPDLVPILSAVACAAEGTTRFTHAERLRAKESDRIVSTVTLLRALGADAEETEDGLTVHGGKPLCGGCADSFGDHRIAMTAAVLRCLCEGDVTVTRAEAVEKSYPAFYHDYAALGGSCSEV